MQNNSKIKKVMIVEDSLIVAMELRENLKRAGYEVVGTAVSGEEAIELFIKSKPDLILMDIMLQGDIDGIEASDKIKKIEDVPIIYTTAYSDEETLKDLKLTVPFAYIKKPYDTKELLITIELALERSTFQKKIKSSENKYRSLFENSIDAIFVIDKDGRFIDYNVSLLRLTGYHVDDFKGRTFTSIINPPEEFLKVKQEIDDRGLIKDYEIELAGKNGDSKICQISGSTQFIDETGEFGYQGIIRDITDLKKSQEKQDILIHGIIQVIAAIVEARDPYTAGHQERVALMSELIAGEMGMPENKINEIKMAAMIHDIGKIHIPSEILSKPTRLTITEYDLMKTHPQTGYNILKEADFPFDLPGIVFQHHERCDGSGYPQKLKKDDIYLESRIISVADVVEAMASHRPYRPAQGFDAAVEEIKEGSGIYYDKDVADAFCRLVERNAFDEIITKYGYNT